MAYTPTGVLNVVLVDVQFGIGISLARRLQGNGDVALAERVVEHVLAEASVVVERLCIINECLVQVDVAKRSSPFTTSQASMHIRISGW